jgi:hypothetical protein
MCEAGGSRGEFVTDDGVVDKRGGGGLISLVLGAFVPNTRH